VIGLSLPGAEGVSNQALKLDAAASRLMLHQLRITRAVRFAEL